MHGNADRANISDRVELNPDERDLQGSIRLPVTALYLDWLLL
jgi:hypothetical protein